MSANYRDRVRELRRVRAGELVPHPHNWRTHPTHQRRALRGVLSEVGYADAVIARELPDGSLQLVDGHLRVETTPDALIPVLVVDLDDAEAEKVLLSHDPLAAMAGVNAAELTGLLARAETVSEPVGELLAKVAGLANSADLEAMAEAAGVDVPELYQVVVECRDSAEQQTVYERMRGEGRRCRVLTL
ncbi:MAG: ParB N-terminal domain-containing protein [Planctomycetota bacterium]